MTPSTLKPGTDANNEGEDPTCRRNLPRVAGPATGHVRFMSRQPFLYAPLTSWCRVPNRPPVIVECLPKENLVPRPDRSAPTCPRFTAGIILIFATGAD